MTTTPSLCSVADFSIEQRRSVLERSLRVKELVRKEQAGATADHRNHELDTFYAMHNDRLPLYLVFMEPSTRTKESFRAAAQFHNLCVRDFACETSSFKKNETIGDTFSMLAGYRRTATAGFVVRSQLEGVAHFLRWYLNTLPSHRSRAGIHVVPSGRAERFKIFNAGDGRHEHPSQELLDGVSIAELVDARTAAAMATADVHIALVGDLLHGRTAHSKVHGLSVFGGIIRVDLVAPEAIAMPAYNEQEMRTLYGADNVRVFRSLDAYCAQQTIAPVWYCTRLQAERLSPELLERRDELLAGMAVTHAHAEAMRTHGVRILHPLPRDAKFCELPFWLDKTEHNYWGEQAENGYFARISLLGSSLWEEFGGSNGEVGGAPQATGEIEVTWGERAVVCPNERCVSRPEHGQRDCPGAFKGEPRVCAWCETPMAQVTE